MNTMLSGFRQTVTTLLEQIEAEHPAIERAAGVIADAVAADRMVHVIGPGGHSNMGVEEVLWRAVWRYGMRFWIRVRI